MWWIRSYCGRRIFLFFFCKSVILTKHALSLTFSIRDNVMYLPAYLRTHLKYIAEIVCPGISCSSMYILHRHTLQCYNTDATSRIGDRYPSTIHLHIRKRDRFSPVERMSKEIWIYWPILHHMPVHIYIYIYVRTTRIYIYKITYIYSIRVLGYKVRGCGFVQVHNRRVKRKNERAQSNNGLPRLRYKSLCRFRLEEKKNLESPLAWPRYVGRTYCAGTSWVVRKPDRIWFIKLLFIFFVSVRINNEQNMFANIIWNTYYINNICFFFFTIYFDKINAIKRVERAARVPHLLLKQSSKLLPFFPPR